MNARDGAAATVDWLRVSILAAVILFWAAAGVALSEIA